MKQTIILLTLLLLAACVQVENQSTEPIKIGWIGPLTGTGASYGVLELNSATIAVDEINAVGGINGRQIKLVIEDGKCEGATAVTAANKLIDVDKVQYILGGHCSTETLSIIPVTEAKHVFVMAGATSTGKFTGAGNYTFRTTSPSKDVNSKLAEYAYEHGIRNMVTFNEEKDFPKSTVDSFSAKFTELGGKIIGKETYAPGTTDFKTQLLKISALKPDAVMISVQGPDSSANIVKQMHELGINLQIYGDILVVSTATYEKSQGLLPSTAIGGSAHINPAKSPKTQAFIDTYHTRFGKIELDPFLATEGYDGLVILSELIKTCGDDIDCARKEILSKPWQGITGTFQFNGKGDPNAFVGVKHVVNGTEVYDYESE